jgi:hypothetical protein
MKKILMLSLCMSFSAFGMDWQAIVEGEERTGNTLKEVVQLRKESEKELVQAQAAVQKLEKQTPQDKTDKSKKISALGEKKHGEMAGELEKAIVACAGWKELAIEWHKKADQLQGQVDTLQAASNRRGLYTHQVMQISALAVPFLLYLAIRHGF